jgi:hypothetical protein
MTHFELPLTERICHSPFGARRRSGRSIRVPIVEPAAVMQHSLISLCSLWLCPSAHVTPIFLVP